MKILQIMCHPDFDGKHRISNILAKIGEEKLIEEGFNNIEKINLYNPSTYIPMMDKFMFNYEGVQLTEKEQQDKIRQKEHNAIHVSLFSNSGSYVTLYLRHFTPEDLVAVMNSLIKQKKELGYERLICLLSELKNDERLSLLMKLSKMK